MLCDFYEPFVKLNRAYTQDLFGGDVWMDIDGAEIQAAISMSGSAEQRIATKTGVKSKYRIATDISIKLKPDDRLRRVRDGRIYRITSEPMTTPDIANTAYSIVDAEVIDV